MNDDDVDGMPAWMIDANKRLAERERERRQIAELNRSARTGEFVSAEAWRDDA